MEINSNIHDGYDNNMQWTMDVGYFGQLFDQKVDKWSKWKAGLKPGFSCMSCVGWPESWLSIDEFIITLHELMDKMMDKDSSLGD